MTNQPNRGTEALAIQAINCTKSYSSGKDVNNVFTELNLNIPRSCIYALLGASGCGKTTLLRCILGRLKLTKGRILVYGHPPGSRKSGVPGKNVGYMPQDIALFDMLTVSETLQYYGKVFGLEDEEIKSRINYFVKYLHLPSKDIMNKNLSGGQQRRVSFIVATMHKPQLIILDEPTVGIDPIVKNSMLTFLTNLVAECQTTIVLTTHYIEEARSATMVGMLRKGRLIVQDTPDAVIRKYNASSLEDVFLKLCLLQTEFPVESSAVPMSAVKVENGHNALTIECPPITEIYSKPEETTKKLIYDFIPESLLDELRLPNMRRVFATVRKNFIRLRRFPGALLFLFVFPMFQFANSCFALGGYIRDVKVAIVNEDNGVLGSKYLDFMKSGLMMQEHYLSYDTGYEALLNGNAYAMMHISANFSQALVERFTETPMISYDSIVSSTINVFLDKSDFIIAKTLNFEMLKSLQEFSRDTVSDLGFSRNSVDPPLNIHEHDSFWVDQPFRVFMVPSFMIVCAFSAQVLVAVLFLFMEKVNGYLERAFIAGVTTVEVILGFIALQFFVITGQVIGILIVTFLAFDTPLYGSIFLVMGLGFLSGMNGMSVGLLVSAVFNDVLTLSSISIVATFIILAVSGSFWPIEAMPYFLQYICKIIPFYLPSKAMKEIMYRGWNLFDPEIILGFGVSFTWSFFLLVLTAIFFKAKRS